MARGLSMGSCCGSANIRDGPGHGLAAAERARTGAAATAASSSVDLGSVFAAGVHRRRSRPAPAPTGRHGIRRGRRPRHWTRACGGSRRRSSATPRTRRTSSAHGTSRCGHPCGRKLMGAIQAEKLFFPTAFSKFLTYLAPRVVRHVFPRFFFWPLPRRPSYPDSPHRARARRYSAPVTTIAQRHTPKSARHRHDGIMVRAK
jgi:hypothetical protein